MAVRVWVFATLLAVSAITHAPAQSPSAQTSPQAAEPQQRPPTFRTGTELVRVDATVIDRSGRPVTSLTARDFEVEEDGIPQEITSFRFIEATGEPVDGKSLPIRSASHAAAEAARDDVRVFLIFWDEYHIEERVSALRARESLMTFVRTAFGPTDLVAFMDPLTTLDSLRFTRDRYELAETVRSLRGRLGVYSPARSAVEESQLRYARSIEQVRSQVTMSALKSAVVHLSTLREGRKSIILVSQGMRGLGRDAFPMTSDLIRAANHANTAIYAVDPRGLMPQGSQSGLLSALSAETGGESFPTNRLDLAFHRAVSQASAFYLIGYAPAMPRFDGRFHQIKVRVKRPGLQVRARAGYWAPTAGDMVRASELAAKATLPAGMEAAFDELVPATAHRSIDVWIGTGIRAGVAEVRMTWQPRALGTGQAPQDPTEVCVIATGESGPVFHGSAGSRGVTFSAPAGRLQLMLIVSNRAGETIDREQRTVMVPDPASLAFSIGEPAVFRARNPLEFRAIDGETPLPPHAGREFLRTDRLLVQFDVFGAAPSDVSVSAELISRRGERLADLPLANPAESEMPWSIDLALANVARGDYLIALNASRGEQRARSFIPLRILR